MSELGRVGLPSLAPGGAVVACPADDTAGLTEAAIERSISFGFAREQWRYVRRPTLTGWQPQ